ncbi:MAG TPA: right-handed parallel beta-helix repeat-containing protein [Chthoniobacteraceae bacterium]|nr:right-handed parallel beta-helix repeat-containing protein [Chthoniobacteraceae bacterium]
MKLLAASFLFLPAIMPAAEVAIRTADELRAALRGAKPGTQLVLAAGSYTGGFYAGGLRGEPGKPIVIKAADPSSPPVFTDAKTGLHLSGPAHVELKHLTFRGLSDNGLNIDDGGNADQLAQHISLDQLVFEAIGSRGNQDAIKLSGIADFRVIDCVIKQWGTGGGSGIDMVGCHRGVISGNAFAHNRAPNCTGVQCKGGTSDITIRQNQFEDAGGRAVNIGGSTGLQFFRPKLKDGEEHAEARNIVVEGNTFTGSMAAVAFVGVDGAKVQFNTIKIPERWALRILQETKNPGFVACRNGEFTDNLVIFESQKWGEGGVNIGAGTAPETFKFARNWWYCIDRPDRSEPKLPTPEKDGVYGKNPDVAKGKAGAGSFQASRDRANQ